MKRMVILAVAAAICAVGMMSLAPIAQDPTYHLMADRRSLFGIPNGLNVLSSVPFVIIGAIGVSAMWSRGAGGTLFRDRWLRWSYAVVFAAVLLTGFGSAYYHLAPDNARLVWDRLPMTVGFMALLTAVLAERLSMPLARILLIPLLAVGAGSVAYWFLTEVGGAGDLRVYVLVQFGALLMVVLVLLLYPARELGTGYLVAGLVAYAVAKCFELADAHIFALGQLVSGHTLKHLSAAVGVGCIVAMIRARARSRSSIDQAQSPADRVAAKPAAEKAATTAVSTSIV